MSIEEIKIIVAFVLLFGTAGLTSWITHKVDNSKYEALELTYKQKENDAIKNALNEQNRLDELKTQAALEDITKQRNIANTTRNQLNEVKKYIKDTCITWNTIRLYQSTILGVSPDSVPIPAGVDGSSCSGIGSTELTSNFINNIGICKTNAQSLNSARDYYLKAQTH